MTWRTEGVRVFHRTTRHAADDIHLLGFHAATDTYMTDREFTGVWISDVPLDANDGAEGEALLTLKIPSQLFRKYEWVEGGKGYREALIPATELNRYGPPRLVSPEAEDRFTTHPTRRSSENANQPATSASCAGARTATARGLAIASGPESIASAEAAERVEAALGGGFECEYCGRRLDPQFVHRPAPGRYLCRNGAACRRAHLEANR